MEWRKSGPRVVRLDVAKRIASVIEGNTALKVDQNVRTSSYGMGTKVVRCTQDIRVGLLLRRPSAV